MSGTSTHPGLTQIQNQDEAGFLCSTSPGFIPLGNPQSEIPLY